MHNDVAIITICSGEVGCNERNALHEQVCFVGARCPIGALMDELYGLYGRHASMEMEVAALEASRDALVD